MPRKPRVEYAGAVYHVMSRGNHLQKVFFGEYDCRVFLETLGEVCRRSGWRVHAYVLMGSHYHLLLETPEPNLVAGMQWLQGTYTKRFNAAHRKWKHLFQGRYKAIPVEPGGMYFTTVATYIHLNPVRVKGYDFGRSRLEDHVQSSYPGYIGNVQRPEWLFTRRVLAQLGMADTAAGRRKYAEYMRGRVEEVRNRHPPWKADPCWQSIRRGWHFGGEEFRQEILKHVEDALHKGRRTSFSGQEIQEHDEAAAEAWIAKGMEKLGLREADIEKFSMNCPEKYALAWLARKHTSVRLAWIRARLRMGTATSSSAYLKRLEGAQKGKWGYEAWEKVRAIQLSILG